MNELINNKPLTFEQKSLMYSSEVANKRMAELDDLKRWGLRKEERPLLPAEKSKVKFTSALRSAMRFDVYAGVQSFLP